jgi:aminopeptidase N
VRRHRSAGLALAATLTTVLLTSTATAATAAPVLAAKAGSGSTKAGAAPAPTPGAPGAGDPYFPKYGNGGYDVSHYRIAVSYNPAQDMVTGTTTIIARSTKALSRFNLDLALTPRSVKVNGVAAGFGKNGGELVVTPAAPLAQGAAMSVTVTYGGIPSSVTLNGINPWVRTPTGAVAVGQPEIAAWWFPSNDHPSDKATFDVSLTVPSALKGISNGILSGISTSGARSTWHWVENKPMATYLAFMAVGKYSLSQGKSAKGIPYYTAIAENVAPWAADIRTSLARTPKIVDWLSGVWGPYPFNSTGGLVPDADFGYALENQTRPIYTRSFWQGGPDEYVIVHENAHQWFGDSVSLSQWKDIWLNEGFATFNEWYYSEHLGEGSGADIFNFLYTKTPDNDSFWDLPIGDPGPAALFDIAVYDRGAMTLQALRNRLGDPTFFQVLRNWVAENKYGNGSVEDFIALAEHNSGEDLTSFFQAWLFTAAKPAATAENGIDSAGRVTAGARRAEPASLAKIRATHQLLAGRGGQ